MQITTPLSLVPRSQAHSPDKILHHQDSLVFSITSEKFNSRKQTLLLEDSKQLKNQFIELKKDSLQLKQHENDLNFNKYSFHFKTDTPSFPSSTQQFLVKDYFKIQDKIKILQQKVQNIKTNYCESESKQYQRSYQQRQMNNKILNMEFPQEIYQRNILIDNENDNQNFIIGKIKRKKEKYYTGMEQKNREQKSKSKENTSNLTTKRHHNINNTTQNLSSYSVISSKRKNSTQKTNKSIRSNRSQSKQNHHSYSNINSFTSFIKHKNSSSVKKKNPIPQPNSNNQTKNVQIKHLRQQLIRTKLSQQKNSRKSHESLRKLSQSKGEIRKLKNQSIKYKNQIDELKRKLKKSQTIKQRQKHTILQQKEQIHELKKVIQQILKKNQIDITKIKTLRV